ncbi:hypothetical protein Tco_0430133, partial [Tanacetum coccineum]
MVSLQMGVGGSGGDGILGRGDDKGDSGDGDGDGGVGATSHALMCVSKDDGATSSLSNGSVSSDGESGSTIASVEAAKAK